MAVRILQISGIKKNCFRNSIKHSDRFRPSFFWGLLTGDLHQIIINESLWLNKIINEDERKHEIREQFIIDLRCPVEQWIAEEPKVPYLFFVFKVESVAVLPGGKVMSVKYWVYSQMNEDLGECFIQPPKCLKELKPVENCIFKEAPIDD